MSEVETLKRAYREIEAPAGMAARVHAQLDARTVRPWMPSPVAVAAIIAIVTLSVALWQVVDRSAVNQPVSVSFPVLAGVTPLAPKVAMPGLSSVQSVGRPALPPRPTGELNIDAPRLNHLISKENNHA